MYAKIINLGDKCNNNCYFCFNKNKVFANDFLQLSIAVKEGRKQNYEQVVFTGQEPTLYPRLRDLILLAKKLDYKVIQVVSNGRLFTRKDYAERIIDAGMTELLVPIFSHHRAIHDRITQIPGSFEQAIQGIMNVMNIPKGMRPYKSVNVTVGVVVCIENYRHVLPIAEFLNDLKVKQVFYIKDRYLNGVRYHQIRTKLLDDLRKAAIYLRHYDVLCSTQGFEEVTQKRVEMYLLWKCTNDCIFCIESGKKQKYWEKVYSLEHIEQQLQEESGKGANHATFLGGEPTLHPDFPAILKTAKELGYTTSITTNAVRLASNEFLEKVRPYLDEVIISVHGHNAEIHELNTRRKGSFRKIQAALDNLNEYYDNLKLNCVITKYNYRHLIDIVKFGKKNNIEKIGLCAVDLSVKGSFPGSQERFDEIISCVPHLADVKPHLLCALEYADTIGLLIRTADIPLCVLDKHYSKSDDFFYTNRTKIDEHNKRLDRKYIPARKKIKIEMCQSCKLNDMCKGILSGYYDIYKNEKHLL